MHQIFENSKLGKIELKNRLIRSGTWEGLAKPDGNFDLSMLPIYEELAQGGIGLIITGSTSVMSQDTATGTVLKLSKDLHIDSQEKLVSAIHAHNVPIVIQLALWTYNEVNSQGKPKAKDLNNLSLEQLSGIRAAFVAAALRAQKAGFDGIQIHAAHGSFLSRMSSPLFNQRTDDYGGSILNRTRLMVEILDCIKAAAPDLTVLLKINASDDQEGGIEIEDVKELCTLFQAHGGDGIEISANNTALPAIKAHKNEAYLLPYATQIRQAVSIPLIVVGGFRALDTIKEALTNGPADYISLARPLIREPDLPLKFKADKNYVAKCVSCNQCFGTFAHRCIFNKRS